MPESVAESVAERAVESVSAGAAQGAEVQLVVPCFNEAQRLDQGAFAQALSHMPWLHYCFVNDGSTDSTSAVLERLCAQSPWRVRVLTLPANVGKAEAVRQGLLAVHDQAPLCGFWDADLAAPLAEVATLRHVLLAHERFEWVWGARVRTLGRQITRQASRHYLGRLFATAASLTLGVPSYDTQCGAKLFRSSPLLRAVIAEPFCSRWVFDVELLSRADALLRASGRPGVAAEVFEQPLDVWRHQAGSKVKPTDLLRSLWELRVIQRAQSTWARPLDD